MKGQIWHSRPYQGMLIGALLLALVSWNKYNACEIASNNTVFIKEQTQLAIEATTFDMAKYHAYKALNGVVKTKAKFVDCGCNTALQTLDDAGEHLKEATRSDSMEDAATFLQISLKNLELTINTLEEFEVSQNTIEEYTSDYRDDVLVMNTKEELQKQGGLVLPATKRLQEVMDESLMEFEYSLGNVVAHVECADAFSFINKILDKSDKHLQRDTLTKAQRYYHSNIKNIAYEALLQLQGCPGE